jgi:hypothetical protein
MSQYKLNHNMDIAAEILGRVSKGTPVMVVFNYCKETWPLIAPKSLATFYKVYRLELAQAKANMHSDVASVIFDKAVNERDMQALALIAKGKLGWNDKVTVETDPEEVNEDTGAIDDLINLLNIKKTGEDAEELLV